VSEDQDKFDHVDRVRAQWREVRPDLDTEPIAVVARLGRARAHLEHGLAELFAEHGLSRPAWDVLASLRRTGPPYQLSPTELYRGLMRSSGTITHRLAGLERAGLIGRVADPDDGRGMLVALTADGLALVDRVAPAHMENERRLLAALSAEEQEQLAAILRTLLLSLEHEFPLPPPRPRRRHRP
jgi:DNA-binding MarR family transcriptional regulator